MPYAGDPASSTYHNILCPTIPTQSSISSIASHSSPGGIKSLSRHHGTFPDSSRFPCCLTLATIHTALRRKRGKQHLVALVLMGAVMSRVDTELTYPHLSFHWAGVFALSVSFVGTVFLFRHRTRIDAIGISAVCLFFLAAASGIVQHLHATGYDHDVVCHQFLGHCGSYHSYYGYVVILPFSAMLLYALIVRVAVGRK